MTMIWSSAAGTGTALAIHGGASARPSLLDEDEKAQYHEGLRRSLAAGQAVLAAGGPAADAVCAAVVELEDSPLFNAGHGAALNAECLAELDAALMLGSGDVGAVVGSTIARNPIRAARAVLERTDHVMLLDPPAALLDDWDVTTVPREYFVTEHRIAQVRELQARAVAGPRHGTVGAVARDASGALAAATSTGGTANQMVGRIGDAPVPGAGTWAADATVAISCTGHGEAFLRQTFAHDVHARMALLGEGLDTAAAAAMAALGAKHGRGGFIAVDRLGNALLTYNTEGMFSGYLEDGEIRTHV
jgi:beta-aspartyl-peptidase (threonine type)